VIAITDGLDTASTNPALPNLPMSVSLGSFDRNNLAQYYSYLTQLLEEKHVNMASISINGADTFVQPSLNSSLSNKSLNESFADIASSTIAVSNQLNTYTFSSAVYPTGTLVRIVLDGQKATESEKYIQGKVFGSGSSYKLTNVMSHGISLLGEPSEIQGEKKDLTVNYIVTVKDTFDKSLVRQWYIQPFNQTEWALDSESGDITVNNSVLDSFKKNSAVIYLVLDGSSSAAGNIDQIRRSAKNVINLLYSTIATPPAPSILVNTQVAPRPAPEPPKVQPLPVKNQANLDNVLPIGYWIQVGSYLSQENAEYAQRQLKAKDISTQITLTRGYGESLFLLQAGPFKTEEAALQCYSDIRRSQWGFFATDMP
jgi:hypothetical protein